MKGYFQIVTMINSKEAPWSRIVEGKWDSFILYTLALIQSSMKWHNDGETLL